MNQLVTILRSQLKSSRDFISGKRKRNIENENLTPSPDCHLESTVILSSELNLMLSHEVDSIVTTVHAEINRVINSAMNAREISDIKKPVTCF